MALQTEHQVVPDRIAEASQDSESRFVAGTTANVLMMLKKNPEMLKQLLGEEAGGEETESEGEQRVARKRAKKRVKKGKMKYKGKMRGNVGRKTLKGGNKQRKKANSVLAKNGEMFSFNPKYPKKSGQSHRPQSEYGI